MFIVEIETSGAQEDTQWIAGLLREVAHELETDHADTGIEPVGVIADNGEVVGKYEYET